MGFLFLDQPQINIHQRFYCFFLLMFFVNLFELNFFSPIYLPICIFILNQLFISSLNKFENLGEFGFIFNDKLKSF